MGSEIHQQNDAQERFCAKSSKGVGEKAGTLTQTDPKEIQLLINIAVEGMAWKKFAEEGRSSEGVRAKYLWEDAIKVWEDHKKIPFEGEEDK